MIDKSFQAAEASRGDRQPLPLLPLLVVDAKSFEPLEPFGHPAHV